MSSTAGLFSIMFSIFICSFFSTVLGQEKQTDFDRVYMDIATRVRATDIDKAIFRTDSLLENSQNSLQKIKTTLLLSLFYEDKGELANAIYWATLSEELAINNKNYEFQVRSSGYLATLYRRLNLTTESNLHILIAEKANSKRKSEPNYPIIQSTIHHEKTFHLLEKGRIQAAINEVEKSLKSLNEVDNISHLGFISAGIYETYANCYLQLEEFEKAKEKSLMGLSFDLENYPELISTLNSYLGLVELHYKNYDKAYEYLEIAGKLTDKLPNLAVQITVYEAFKKYYEATNDLENTLNFSNKIADLNVKRTEDIKKVTNELLVKMHSKKDKITIENNYLFWIALFLIIIIVITIILYKNLIKRKNKKYINLLEKLDRIKNEQLKNEKEDEVVKPSSIENKNPQPIMTPETESRLLKQLKKLEKEKFFLDKDISLSSLTIKLNSNSRYVSYIIKNYKNTDVNNYINELRILYIVQLLREEPRYLTYKLSYIADIAGFSSHSKFTTIFKKFTDITPSRFIKEVEKEREKELEKEAEKEAEKELEHEIKE